MSTPSTPPTPLPPLQVVQWFNTETPPRLDLLRGRVVVVHAFQMLCPACVAQSLPQAMRVHAQFSASDLVVLGLHTVFEHHEVMGPEALKAFLHEYRITFPVGVDLPAKHHGVPATMQAYGLRGTPSCVVLDRQGRVRLNHFGHMDDLSLGVLLGALVAEPPPILSTAASSNDKAPSSPNAAQHLCGPETCPLPEPGAHP